MSPASGRAHQRAVSWLISHIDPYVVRVHAGELLPSPADIELNPETISQPDLFVIPPEQADGSTWVEVSAIILSIEVLSPGTARNDRGKKRKHYQRAGVAEYWIVDLEARLIERWRPTDVRPEILSEQLVWHPTEAAAPLTLALADLWAATRIRTP